MEKKKVTEFVKTYWKPIAIAAGLAIVGGTVACVITKRAPKFPKYTESHMEATPKIKDLAKPDWKLGVLDEFWSERDHIHAIVNDITVADCGKLGEEFLKIENVNPETYVSVFVGLGTGE